MAPTTRARFVHNRRRGPYADEEEQDAPPSSSSSDDGDEEEEDEEEVEGPGEVDDDDDDEDDEDVEEEAAAAEPAAKESPAAAAAAAAGRSGRKGSITISLKKVCKVVVGAGIFFLSFSFRFPIDFAVCFPFMFRKIASFWYFELRLGVGVRELLLS